MPTNFKNKIGSLTYTLFVNFAMQKQCTETEAYNEVRLRRCFYSLINSLYRIVNVWSYGGQLFSVSVARTVKINPLSSDTY